MTTTKLKQISGLSICFFGKGKGKTSAALGIALRAAGYNKQVLIVQFIKGDWFSGEEKSIKKLKSLKLKKMGLGFVGLGNDVSILSHRDAADKAFDEVKKALLGKRYDVIIADEILGAIKGDLIKEKKVLGLIGSRPANKTLILTGRPEYPSITSACEMVSEIKKIKHPFDKGIGALEGIDY
jgi:cob(I)alamin adenosyltransferase